MSKATDANNRLMNAAIDLICAERYGAVTIDDICEKAGVEKGGFHHFFPSKSTLAVGALDRMWLDDWKPQLDTFFAPSLDPLARISGYVRALYSRAVERFHNGESLGCLAGSPGSEVNGFEAEVSAKTRELILRRRRYFETAIREAVAHGKIAPCDVARKTDAFARLLEGAVVQSRIVGNPEILRHLSGAAFQLLGPEPA